MSWPVSKLSIFLARDALRTYQRPDWILGAWRRSQTLHLFIVKVSERPDSTQSVPYPVGTQLNDIRRSICLFSPKVGMSDSAANLIVVLDDQEICHGGI